MGISAKKKQRNAILNNGKNNEKNKSNEYTLDDVMSKLKEMDKKYNIFYQIMNRLKLMKSCRLSLHK